MDASLAESVRARALAYLERRGTSVAAAALGDEVVAAFTAFEAQLAAVPAADCGRRPAPERWSAQEIVAHLVASHQPAVGELRSLLAGESPGGGPIPADLLPVDANGRGWEAWVTDLTRVHRDLVALLATAGDATPTAARAPVRMVVKTPSGERLVWDEPLDWKAYAQALRVHTLEHGQQLERTLASLAPGAARAGFAPRGGETAPPAR